MNKKVRYAVVGLGDISQEAMLPGIEATGNSELVAVVTSDPEKARVVSKQYGIDDSYGYSQFQALLESGTIDAIYLATPNWRPRGVHHTGAQGRHSRPDRKAARNLRCEMPRNN